MEYHGTLSVGLVSGRTVLPRGRWSQQALFVEVLSVISHLFICKRLKALSKARKGMLRTSHSPRPTRSGACSALKTSVIHVGRLGLPSLCIFVKYFADRSPCAPQRTNITRQYVGISFLTNQCFLRSGSTIKSGVADQQQSKGPALRAISCGMRRLSCKLPTASYHIVLFQITDETTIICFLPFFYDIG